MLFMKLLVNIIILLGQIRADMNWHRWLQLVFIFSSLVTMRSQPFLLASDNTLMVTVFQVLVALLVVVPRRKGELASESNFEVLLLLLGASGWIIGNALFRARRKKSKHKKRLREEATQESTQGEAKALSTQLPPRQISKKRVTDVSSGARPLPRQAEVEAAGRRRRENAIRRMRTAHTAVQAFNAAATRKQRPPPLPPTADEIFRQIDSRDEGRITIAELLRWWSQRQLPVRVVGGVNVLQNIRTLFEQLEMANTETLDEEEFADTLDSLVEAEYQEATDPTTQRPYFLHLHPDAEGKQASAWQKPSINMWLSSLFSSTPPRMSHTASLNREGRVQNPIAKTEEVEGGDDDDDDAEYI